MLVFITDDKLIRAFYLVFKFAKKKTLLVYLTKLGNLTCHYD